MSVKYETIKPGDVLYQKKRVRMGNTTLTQDIVYSVRVVDVGEFACDVVWNGCNKDRRYRRTMESLYRSPPKTKLNPFSRSSQ